MRIGILTFHDEVNYGSLLQAYAMQSALIRLGHEAVILDRWFQPGQDRLYGILHQRSFLEGIKFLLGIISFNGMISKYLRMWRSRRFIRKHLHLTAYHFCECEDAPKDLGLDLIIVGSDQVWHPNARPDIYLLNWVRGVPGIAYAASFGVNDIPDEMRELYRNGFKNFKAIGARELEGVRIVESLGGNAMHVVDPTLLAPREVYDRFLGPNKSPHITCYFLSENYADYAVKLGRFARQNHLTVEFYVQDFEIWSISNLLKCKFAQLVYPIKIRYSAGPEGFVSSVATAMCVFTNSFHALMFSMIYRRNVRVVKPTAPWRKGMSARMQEMSDKLIRGPLIAETIDDAMSSYCNGEFVSYNEEELSRRIEASERWLQNAVRDEIAGGDR